MRGKNQRVIFIVLIAGLAGIGYALHMYSQNSLRQKLTEQRRKIEVELERLPSEDVTINAKVFVDYQSGDE